MCRLRGSEMQKYIKNFDLYCDQYTPEVCDMEYATKKSLKVAEKSG